MPPSTELSARSATSVADPPSWTTRAKPKGIARVPTHAVRPPEERRSYARAKLSLPLRVKRIAGQRERMGETVANDQYQLQRSPLSLPPAD